MKGWIKGIAVALVIGLPGTWLAIQFEDSDTGRLVAIGFGIAAGVCGMLTKLGDDY